MKHYRHRCCTCRALRSRHVQYWTSAETLAQDAEAKNRRQQRPMTSRQDRPCKHGALISRRSAIAWDAIRPRVAGLMPGGIASIPPSEHSSRPTSHPIRKPGSGNGMKMTCGGRCMMAKGAMARHFTRRSPIRSIQRSPARTPMPFSPIFSLSPLLSKKIHRARSAFLSIFARSFISGVRFTSSRAFIGPTQGKMMSGTGAHISCRGSDIAMPVTPPEIRWAQARADYWAEGKSWAQTGTRPRSPRSRKPAPQTGRFMTSSNCLKQDCHLARPRRGLWRMSSARAFSI